MNFVKGALLALGMYSAANAGDALKDFKLEYNPLLDTSYYVYHEKPTVYLDFSRESKRYLVWRKDFDRLCLEIRLSGAWEYDFRERMFLDPKGELIVDLYLKRKKILNKNTKTLK
ncbi:hypothetical protein KY345_00715 [Candidatus Woesearchaeota archaeon]|nr:hypothetical protein [Candidatus Woesearchaeota archaeon]